MLTLLIILIVAFVLIPHLGISIPAPLNQVLGIILFVVLLVWLLSLLGVSPRL